MIDGVAFGKEFRIEKAEINGNSYAIIMYPSDNFRYKSKVLVYAKKDGSDFSLSGVTIPVDIRDKNLGRISQTEQKADEEFYQAVSRALNEAICKLENKKDKRQEFEDNINAVIEANKEIHGGLDYQIEKLK